MGPGGRPKVEHNRRQRLDLEAAETLIIYMVEKQTKGSCGGNNFQKSEESAIQFIDKGYTAHNRTTFSLTCKEQVH